MNSEHLSPREYAALIDAAKRHALALRAEATAEFRSAVGRAARSAWRSIRRGVRAADMSHPQETSRCPR